MEPSSERKLVAGRGKGVVLGSPDELAQVRKGRASRVLDITFMPGVALHSTYLLFLVLK